MLGPTDDLPWGVLTPAGSRGKHPATTKVGKYNKVPVEMVSNARARKTITDRTLPTDAFDAMGYMRHMFRDAPEDWKHLASGGYGSAFLVTVTDVTKRRLQSLHGDVKNKVEQSHINYVPNKTKLVLKVITAGNDNRYWQPNAAEKRYMEDYAQDEREKRGVARKKKIDTALQKDINRVVSRRKSDVRAMKPADRDTFLKDHVAGQKRAVWDFVLNTGSMDASNHAYIMRTDPVTFRCGQGTATVRARDVIPHLYFGGSHNIYGVYVIVMGYAHGKPLKSIDPGPLVVANLEKAMFTLAASGVEHGDAHTANIFATLNGDVQFLDFGMSVIMPRAFKDRAARKLGACVRALQKTGEWPERWSNSVWYGDDHKGKNERSIMRYLNSYMRTKVNSWYNPSGKMLRFMKGLTTKEALDVARTIVWSEACVRKSPSPKRSPSPKSPLDLVASPPKSARSSPKSARSSPKSKNDRPRSSARNRAPMIMPGAVVRNPTYHLNYGEL